MLNLINQIAKASGNEKLEILKNHPELKEIMEWTYNPFKRYFFTAPGIHVNNTWGTFIIDEFGNLTDGCKDYLTCLNDRTLSGNDAIEKINDYIAGMKQDSAILFQRILDKDLRIGLGASSINKVWPGLIPTSEDGEGDFKIMYVKNYKEGKMPFPCLAAPKLDGVRGRFYNGKMYSRQRKRLIGLEHIEGFLNELCGREGIEKDFDGELAVPGDIFDSASGLIRNGNSVPEAVFNIFDIPSDSRNKKARWNHLSNIFHGVDDKVRIIEHEIIGNEIELQVVYDNYVSDGHEGIVIYDPDSEYEEHSPTRRTNSWMRIVPLKTADCKMVGSYEGKGKYVGSLGGIVVDYKGHDVNIGTGFSDELRERIWNNRIHYESRIVECEFKEETKAGSMRQPRFKEFRFDKTEPNFD